MRIYHLKGGFLDNSESVEPFALKFKSFCSKRVFWIIWYDNVFCYTSKSLEAEPPKLIKTVGIWNKIMFMCNGVDKLLTDTARRECPADLITLVLLCTIDKNFGKFKINYGMKVQWTFTKQS